MIISLSLPLIEERIIISHVFPHFMFSFRIIPSISFLQAHNCHTCAPCVLSIKLILVKVPNLSISSPIITKVFRLLLRKISKKNICI